MEHPHHLLTTIPTKVITVTVINTCVVIKMMIKKCEATKVAMKFKQSVNLTASRPIKMQRWVILSIMTRRRTTTMKMMTKKGKRTWTKMTAMRVKI